MTSLTEENYLKAIYSLNNNPDAKASTTLIAEKLDTKASSVTDMLKRLNEKKLVNYEKYQAATLTDSGEKVAISIIRKHRLWEYFLVENLDFGWDEVHDIAEQLEHIQSPELTNRLDAYLKYPKFDPHGDPIPNSQGQFPQRKTIKLANAAIGNKVYVTGVKDHSSEFLNYLKELDIQLGTFLYIKNILAFDHSFEIETQEKEKILLSEKVTKNLYVKID